MLLEAQSDIQIDDHGGHHSEKSRSYPKKPSKPKVLKSEKTSIVQFDLDEDCRHNNPTTHEHPRK